VGHDISHLHHVGIVVRDMEEALALYRRLGFILPPPTYPMMPPQADAPPAPFGVANTRAAFRRNFIELVTVVSDSSAIPGDASLVPIRVPGDALPRVRAAIEETIAVLRSCLARFQGAHILVFEAQDVDAAAGRLEASGIGHGDVLSVQLQIETETGRSTVPVRSMEIADDGVPEGRLAVAEPPPSDVQRARRVDHPNGAVDLVEAILCVEGADIANIARRYETYTGRSARRNGPTRVVDLDGAKVTIVPDSDLEAVVPGERARALPAFVAFAVEVRDIDAARGYLRRNGFPVNALPSGDVFVPAAAALGAAVIFRMTR
jgi:catechol 2,3-dioxygenase-like lactoylglutathione lyase family enzyme